ncbi:MAG TPA: SDR family NAD(P)-dependent oxidoreductase [Pseudonocardiaceae bacterium]|jgi:NAD(P)-dependent dehydrogenase (short-subunit alcohol dehydrogenase family)|nr:SDR family NAD(P)-dependent oxidoreductase [Pseudonocardiaceae bacterium]
MDKAVVVTGAAGALGQAVVAELLDREERVIALDLAGPALDQLAERDRVRAFPVDMTDRDAVRRVWERIDTVAIPSALITLAGGFKPTSLADLDEDTLEQMWRTNVVSMLWPCQQAAVRMAAAGGGAIVTVGSRTAISGSAPIAHATTKAAVVRASELLAEELRPDNIRVNCVLPSVLDTPANRTWMSPDLAARAVAPAEVAKVIAFLVSPDSAPTSGARVPVYGRS